MQTGRTQLNTHITVQRMRRVRLEGGDVDVRGGMVLIVLTVTTGMLVTQLRVLCDFLFMALVLGPVVTH